MVIGQRALRTHADALFRLVPASQQLRPRVVCPQAGDKLFLYSSDPQIFCDLRAALDASPITIPAPDGAPENLAIVPPRPQWVARRGMAMRPLYEAAEKMLRACLGDKAVLPRIFPRYPWIDGESWVQLWVEKDDRHGQVGDAGTDFEQYRGALPRATAWLVLVREGLALPWYPSHGEGSSGGRGSASETRRLGVRCASRTGASAVHADGAEWRPCLGDLAFATLY